MNSLDSKLLEFYLEVNPFSGAKRLMGVHMAEQRLHMFTMQYPKDNRLYKVLECARWMAKGFMFDKFTIDKASKDATNAWNMAIDDGNLEAAKVARLCGECLSMYDWLAAYNAGYHNV